MRQDANATSRSFTAEEQSQAYQSALSGAPGSGGGCSAEGPKAVEPYGALLEFNAAVEAAFAQAAQSSAVKDLEVAFASCLNGRGYASLGGANDAIGRMGDEVRRRSEVLHQSLVEIRTYEHSTAMVLHECDQSSGLSVGLRRQVAEEQAKIIEKAPDLARKAAEMLNQ